MRDFSKGFKILLFLFKVSLGIFDEVSDIVYYQYQDFKFDQLKSGMLFFLVLSPVIQTVAWSMLLAQQKLEMPKPIKMDRVKKSNSFFSFIFNFCISFIEYYTKLLFQVIKYIPQSLAITILQEIKIFPFCLFGYTYFKYQAILTRDLMKNLAPHLVLFQNIEEEVEKENVVSLQHIPGDLKHDQIQKSPALNSKISNKSLSNVSNVSPESSSSPKKIINLKLAFQLSQDDKSGSQNQSGNINLDLKKGSSQLEQDDGKNLQNPLLQKSPSNNNDQLFQKYFNKPLIQKPKMNQLSPIKKGNDGIDLMQNTFGNSILLFPNQQRKESIQSPTKRKANLQSNALIDIQDENMQGFGRRRATSVRKKLVGLDKSIQNITHLLKYNNHQQQEITRKRGVSICKRDNQAMAATGVAAIQQIQSNNPITETEMDQEGQNKVFNETDLLLDANIVPTMETLIQDHNLEQFLLITDVIEAMFEALPMTVIQFINNGINNSWTNSDGSYNIFIYFSFFTSLFTIIVHGISLISILYDENIKIFYFTLQFLSKFKMNNNNDTNQTDEEDLTDKTTNRQQNIDQKNQFEAKEFKKSNSKRSNLIIPDQIICMLIYFQIYNLQIIKKIIEGEGFGRIFPMGQEVKIVNFMQLKKLTILRQQACEEIKQLYLFFSGYRYQAQIIINNIKKALQKMKQLNRISIEFDDNDYQPDICPLINQIIQEQNNLNNFQISYYDNPITQENAFNIYKIINSWHFKREGNIEELLFQNQSIFVWRCQKLKTLYPNDLSAIFEERFEGIVTSTPEDKYIVEIILPEKDFTEQEGEELISCLQQWINLKHFQIIYKSMPKKQEDQLVNYARSLEELPSCLIISGRGGLLYKKGYTTQYNYQELLTTENVHINFEKKNENQKRFREFSVKCLMKLIQELKGLTSLSLNLKNNNITSIAGESIGECIDNINSLIDIEINLSDNRLGASGVQNMLKSLEKKGKKFRKILINLSRNLIQNEGASYLIKFLRDQSNQQTVLELGKYSKRGMDQSFFEMKKEILLENLSLDLSNNRLKSDLLDNLMKVIGTLKNLKSLDLKLTGNIIELQTEFNFSQLKELNKLSLTFWCNNFSDMSLNNIFKSMRQIKQLEELTFELISNNMHDKIQNFSGHLDHLNMLKKLEMVYSKNGGLEHLRDFDLTCLEIRHLEELSIELSNCNFSYHGVFEIVKNIQFLSNLLKVDLSFAENQDFNDECTKIIIECLQPLQQLKILILNFQKTSITDVTVELIFKKIVSMTSLISVTFDFLDNKTTEAAMKYIVDGLLRSNHIQHPQFRI